MQPLTYNYDSSPNLSCVNLSGYKQGAYLAAAFFVHMGDAGRRGWGNPAEAEWRRPFQNAKNPYAFC